MGGLARTLSIPTSVSVDIPVENCGTLESASIKASEIKTPDADKMYTKKFTMGSIGAEDRETILKSIFDEEDGVFEYPYDMKDSVTQEQRDERCGIGLRPDTSVKIRFRFPDGRPRCSVRPLLNKEWRRCGTNCSRKARSRLPVR